MKSRMAGPFLCLLSCLLLAATALAEIAVQAPPMPVSFGVVPQQAPSKLLASWGPVLSELQARTGRRFVFRTAPDIPTFEQRLAVGEYDIAYMNPYHFTEFNQGDQGYQAVAKAKDKLIRGILVVRKGAVTQTLHDLEGETLAFPAPAAFAASVLPRAHLKGEGIAFDARYVASHDSVYKAVAKGLYAAGGGVVRTLNATDPEVREQLRVLWTTPGYTPHAIAVHPRVSQDLVVAVRDALVDLSDSEAGRAALDRLKVKGFEPATNADWDDVRGLSIETQLGKDQ